MTAVALCLAPPTSRAQERPALPSADQFTEARARGVAFERSLGAMQRLLRAWLTHADPRTTLLPDRIPGGPGGLAPGDTRRLYTPHNAGADLYPYLVLTSHLTDPGLYHGRMLEMLRN